MLLVCLLNLDTSWEASSTTQLASPKSGLTVPIPLLPKAPLHQSQRIWGQALGTEGLPPLLCAVPAYKTGTWAGFSDVIQAVREGVPRVLAGVGKEGKVGISPWWDAGREKGPVSLGGDGRWRGEPRGISVSWP